MIIGLLQIQFAQQARNPWSDSIVNTLIGNQNWINNLSPLNSCMLRILMIISSTYFNLFDSTLDIIL
jgi:hypothetical protein